MWLPNVLIGGITDFGVEAAELDLDVPTTECSVINMIQTWWEG